MWWWLTGLIVGLWAVMYGIPDVWFHHLQWGAFSGSRDRPDVALTFDDGPGPDTSAVLDELKHLGVHATFFLVSERAALNPELVRRIRDEGHEIGLHMTQHVSAYLMTPWQNYRAIKAGLAQMEALTGARPVLFRPPWGHMNLGTWIAVKRLKLTLVFWNIAPDDWRPNRTSQDIYRYVVQLAMPGAVVVLHDAGGPRKRTVESLSPMVKGLRALGLTPGTLGAMTQDGSLLRRLWMWWELRFTRGWNIQTVPNRGGGEPFLRMGHIIYRGPRVPITKDRVLQSGDPFGEIHFSNTAIAHFSGQAMSGLKALHSIMASLHDLAAWIQTEPDYADVVAVGGVTLLDAERSLERLGFQRVPVTGWTKWSMWFYLIVLMSIYHQSGWKTLKRFSRLKPIRLLMDRDTLMTRYGAPRKSREKPTAPR